MSGDAIHAFDGLTSRVRSLRTRSVQVETLRDSAQRDHTAVKAEIAALGTSIEQRTKVSELFRALMDLMVAKQVKSIEELVTEGLHTIFDETLSFEAEVAPKYNKISVEFFFRRGPKDSPLSHRGHPLESFGGGPTAVASLALRILTVLRMKMWPFLALDEALGAVSDEYVDSTGRFLQVLAAKSNFDILLITHKASFLDHADRAYQCSETTNDDGSTHLTIGSVR